MKQFEYDSTRQDPAFLAVMQTAEKVFASCNRALCSRCGYHRAGKDHMLVVCYTEKLADALIRAGVIDQENAKSAVTVTPKLRR